jgi:hypothetical protein
MHRWAVDHSSTARSFAESVTGKSHPCLYDAQNARDARFLEKEPAAALYGALVVIALAVFAAIVGRIFRA